MLIFFPGLGIFLNFRGQPGFFPLQSQDKTKLSNFCVFVSYPAALSFPRAEIYIWKAKYFSLYHFLECFPKTSAVLLLVQMDPIRAVSNPRQFQISLKSMGVLSILFQAQQRGCLNSFLRAADFPPTPRSCCTSLSCLKFMCSWLMKAVFPLLSLCL